MFKSRLFYFILTLQVSSSGQVFAAQQIFYICDVTVLAQPGSPQVNIEGRAQASHILIEKYDIFVQVSPNIYTEKEQKFTERIIKK